MSNLQPNPKAAEVELESQMLTIKLEALKCFGMLKKPNIYGINDLIHEGIITFFSAYKNYNPTKGASFSTYFQRSLINKLNCILIKSYGGTHNRDIEKPPPPLITEMDDSILNTFANKNTNPASFCNLIFRLKELSEPARKYIIFCIAPPEEVISKLVVKTKSRIKVNNRAKNKIVREFLGMTWKEEHAVREEITQLLKVSQ